MPHTINGVGTWYYGKRDIHRLKGVCEFCGSMGELSSYDTSLYFVVLFVPVIPLQNYRVIEECPSCQKHRVIKARQWRELKANNIKEVIEPLEQNPRDREALLKGLAMSISFQDAELFEKMIPLTEPFREDAEVQSQLAAGFSYFSRRGEATEAYKRSLLAEDKPETRQQLALNLLRLGEPDEAEPLIRHIIENKEADKLYLPFLLVDTYQSQGKHQHVLDLLEQLEAAFPDLANDKDVKKLRAQSTKYLESGKPLKKTTLVDSSRAGVAQGSNWSKWVPLLVVAGLLTAYLGRAFWLGSNCTVYLVNGANQPYDVRINDQNYTLQPGTPQAVHVAEGDIKVEVNRLEIPAQTFKVETPFFTRVFKRPVFVVNPDETAILLKETSIYAQHRPPEPPPTIPLPVQAFHQLEEPDYIFEPFPQTIQVKANSTVTKTRIGVHRWKNNSELVEHLESQVANPALLTNRIKALAQLEPNDLYLLSWLRIHLKTEELLQFLQTRLDQTPLLVEWHRLYQDTSLANGKPTEKLAEEYSKRQTTAGAGDKQNAKYLLGRVVEDPQGFNMIREAASGDNSSFYAMYAVGNRALTSGQFEEAGKWAEKLRQRDSRNLITQRLSQDVYMAQKKYLDLEQYLAANQLEPMTLLLEQFRLAACQADAQRLKDFHTQITAMFRREAPQQVDLMEQMLKSIEASAKGDVAEFLKTTKNSQMAPHMVTPILQNDLKNAEQMYEQQKEKKDRSLRSLCLLYLLAKRQGEEASVKQYWETICEELRTAARSSKSFNNMLAGKEAFTYEAARDAFSSADDKRAVLLVLADRFPKDAAALRELAAKLNFQRDPYSLAITKFLNEATKKKAP